MILLIKLLKQIFQVSRIVFKKTPINGHHYDRICYQITDPSLPSILYKLRESTFSMLPKHNSGAFYPHKTELSKKTPKFPRKLLMENDEVKCFLMIIYRRKYGFS